MTDIRLTLFCIVDGKSVSNAFEVEVESAKSVSALKDLIKTKKTNELSDVDADQLTLWNDISIAFGHQPPKNMIHIIVERAHHKTLEDEHDKNKTRFKTPRNLLTLDEQRPKRERAITVLITTGDIGQALFQQLKSDSCPDDLLVIYQEKSAKFFGEAFSILAILADSKDQNWNFATREMLQIKHKLDDREVEQVLDKMPYHSYDDLVQK
ncbi:hypothetical protein BG005_000735, partial [Podila minutissima]